MRAMQSVRGRLWAALAGLALLSGPALAQDKLTAVHAFPANWVYSKSFLEFVKKANEAGKGSFEITVRGGPETMGMFEQPAAVRDGVVDMVYTPCAFYAAAVGGGLRLTMLLHVVNPSAEIREGYESSVVITESGRTLTGIVVEKDSRVVVLRTAEGQRIVLPKDDIEAVNVTGISLMPEGLLDSLNEQEVRDLFAYLRSGQPLNERK